MRSTGRDIETDLLDTQIRGVYVLETIEQSDELAERLGSAAANRFDREWFFESNSVGRIPEELERICDAHGE